MPTYLYPEDRTGAAASNKVTSELHTISYTSGADFHYITPIHAPFFATGFGISRIIGGSKIPLVEGLDFHFGLRFMSASESLSKPLYGSIVFLTVSEDAIYEIDQYQTLGGQWTLDSNGLVALAANVVKNPRAMTWEQVTNLPQIFTPTDHVWSFGDMVGQTEVVQAILSIANAIASQGTSGNNHYLLKGNPHDLSKFDLNLGQVPNYPAAQLTEVVDPLNNQTLITPLLLHALLSQMGLRDLSNLSTAMRAHLNDKADPHDATKDQVGLSEVENLPVATSQDIVRNLSVNKYLTLSGLKQWMSIHGGSLVEKTLAPIKQGALLMTYCTPEYNRMGVYADGKGGTYESIVTMRDTTCGFIESVPVAHAAKGTVMSTYCTGTTSMNMIADGAGGLVTVIGELNSPKCITTSYPPKGTVLSTECEGTTLVRTVANGSGGTTIERVDNSSQCKVNVNPVRGTLLSFGCVGFNVIGVYADGDGGSYEGIIERNSVDCSYVKPTDPPVLTYPPAGTILGTRCDGYNLQNIVANGSGGSYYQTVAVNSADCNYFPTSTPNVTLTPTRTDLPTTKVGTIYYSSTLTHIWIGDTEVHTITMSGWTPNTTYQIDLRVNSAAWGTPFERSMGVHTVTTDGTGSGTDRFTTTETGIVPVGVYHCWIIEMASKRVSNTLTRTFLGNH